MALICNDCKVIGKTRQIWCEHTGEPCMHVRYCAVSSKYYQTDGASRCKLRGEANGEDNEAGALDRI